MEVNYHKRMVFFRLYEHSCVENGIGDDMNKCAREFYDENQIYNILIIRPRVITMHHALFL